MNFDQNYDSSFFVSNTVMETRKTILENIEKAQLKQKLFYDKKTKSKNFSNGDYVALSVPQRAKLSNPYDGPFIVIGDANVPPNTVKIAKIGHESETQLVSLERIKPWFQPQIRS